MEWSCGEEAWLAGAAAGTVGGSRRSLCVCGGDVESFEGDVVASRGRDVVVEKRLANAGKTTELMPDPALILSNPPAGSGLRASDSAPPSPGHLLSNFSKLQNPFGVSFSSSPSDLATLPFPRRSGTLPAANLVHPPCVSSTFQSTENNPALASP
jgi:hypothetical protein